MDVSAGQKLRQAREAHKLTLEQVSQATRIRVPNLRAMEADDFDSLPSATQARGFLRMYAGYLGLDADLLLADFRATGETAAPSPSQTAPPPEPAAEQFQEAKEIFARIGRQLRYQRELLGLTLDEVEKQTHLRQHYLVAMESGDLDALPSPVQGRGMLSNYATFLGMDHEDLLLRFAEGLQSRLSVRQAATPKEETETAQPQTQLPAPIRRFFSGEVVIGGILILSLVVFVLWSVIRVFSIQSTQETSPTAPSIADVLLASATPTLTETPLPPTVTPLAIPQLFPTQVIATDEQTGEPLTGPAAGKVQLYIAIRQRTWLRVTVDGEVVFDGRVIPGSAYTYTGETQIEILVGSGSAIQIFYNQQDLGTPGQYGQVVNQIFSTTGILAPTPTITPTLAPTPTGTATPVPTRTPAGVPTSAPALP